MSTGTGVKVTAPVVSKKEMEKRVERVQKLRKLDCNKICFDCGERGPQSACTTFNVFVCMMCHGIHREFNHRVKSISMSTFDEAEVAGLEAGGNDVGRKYWLARFKETDFPIPDVNEPRVIREKRIRDFIRMKYIEKRWIPQQDEPEKKKKKKKVKKQESSDEEESDDSEEEREAAKKKAEKEARKAAKAAKKSKAARDSSPTPPLKQLTDVLPEFKDKLVVTDKKANGHEAEEEETEKKKKKKDKEGKKKKDATPATKAAPVADSGAKSSGGNLLDLDFLGGGGAAPVQQQQPAQASNSWDAFDSGSSAQAAPPASNEWATFGNGNGNGNGFASQSQSHQPVQQQQAPQPTPFTQTQQPQQTSLFDTGNPFASPPTQHHQLQQQPQAQASFQQSFQQPFQQPQQQQQQPQTSLFAQQPQPTFQQTHHQQNPLTAHQPAINFVVPSVNSSQTSQSSSTDLFGFGSSTTSVTPQAQAPSSSPAITPSVAPSSQRRALDGDPFADIMSGTATSEFASAASAQQSAYNSNRSKSRYAVEGPGVGKPSSALAGMTGLHSTPGSNTAAAGSANAFAGLGGMGGMGQPQAAAAPASTTAAYGLGGMTAAPMSNPGVNAQLMAQQQMMAQQQAVLQQQLYAQVGPPAGAGGQYSPQQHQQVQLLYQQYMAQQQMMYMMAAQGRGFGGAAPAAAGGMAGFGGMAGMGGMGGGMPQSQAQQPPAAASNPFQF